MAITNRTQLGPKLLSWLWFLPVAVLLLGGLALGFSSRQVTQTRGTSRAAGSYISIVDTNDYDIGQGTTSGNIYINQHGSDDYYVALASDFTVSDSDLNDAANFHFIARSDTTPLDPPLNASDGTTITKAHKIEQLVFFDGSGNITHTYTTAEYLTSQRQPPTTTTSLSNWPLGLGVICLGLLWYGCVMTIRLFQRKAQKSNMATIGAYPPFLAQPSYPPFNPYAQGSGPYDQLSKSYLAPPPSAPPVPSNDAFDQSQTPPFQPPTSYREYWD